MPAIRREFLDPGGDEPRLVTSSSNVGEDYALVIGVNDYPQLRPLRGAIADALAFEAWLIDTHGGGLRNENIRSIFSTANPLTPIGHEINDALEDILLRAERSGGRRFYFYFSGHGAVGDRANDLALCLANWSNLRRRAALSSEAWLDVVVRSGIFDEVAFFLDCCRVWATRAVGLPPHIEFVKPLPRPRGTRVFLAYATEFQRAAVEVDDHSDGTLSESRGIFTQALIAGLQGDACSPAGVVTAAALKKYVERETEKRAHQRGFYQHAEVLNGFEEESHFGSGRPITANHPMVEPRYFESPKSTDGLERAIKEADERSEEWARTYERVREQPHCQILDFVIGDRAAPSRMQLVLLARRTRSGSQSSSVSSGWLMRRAHKAINLTTDALQKTAPDQGCVISAELSPGAYVLRHNGRSSREMALHLYPRWTTMIVVDDAFEPSFENVRVFLIPYADDDTLPTWTSIRNEAIGLTVLNSTTMGGPLGFDSTEIDDLSNPMIQLITAHGIARSHPPRPVHADLIDSIADRLERTLGRCSDICALRLRAALLRGNRLPRVASTDPPMLREGLLAFIEASHQMPELIPAGSLLEYACIERFVDSALSSWPFHPKRSDVDDWLTLCIEDETARRGGDTVTLDPLTMARELGVPIYAITTRLEATRERTTKKKWASQIAHSSQEAATVSRKKPPAGNTPIIPGYQLERMIGMGGMGQVYLAERRTTGQQVAVKVLQLPLAASRGALQRFLREIGAMARLRHDRLMALLDHGEADRSFYFVMPYYERGNIIQWVRRNGAPTLEICVSLILDVLEGLAYVHDCNYVHRDIKPQNLLLDDQGRVVVADLGLAKSFEETELLDITRTGDAAGTAPFMPREQVINFKRVRPATDVWAVAAVFYWLVCGVPPRELSRRSDPFGSVRHDPIISIRERWPAVPSTLGELIDRALSDDPDLRPQNAGAFREQLQNAMNALVASAR